jgi:hypothetical protein
VEFNPRKIPERKRGAMHPLWRRTDEALANAVFHDWKRWKAQYERDSTRPMFYNHKATDEICRSLAVDFGREAQLALDAGDIDRFCNLLDRVDFVLHQRRKGVVEELNWAIYCSLPYLFRDVNYAPLKELDSVCSWNLNNQVWYRASAIVGHDIPEVQAGKERIEPGDENPVTQGGPERVEISVERYNHLVSCEQAIDSWVYYYNTLIDTGVPSLRSAQVFNEIAGIEVCTRWRQLWNRLRVTWITTTTIDARQLALAIVLVLVCLLVVELGMLFYLLTRCEHVCVLWEQRNWRRFRSA